MRDIIIIRDIRKGIRLPLPKPGGPMSTKKGKKGFNRRYFKRVAEKEIKEALIERRAT